VVEGLEARYNRKLAALYARHEDELCARGRALPGAREALTALAEQPGVVQTVLTGNSRAVAVIKLHVFGLDRLGDLTNLDEVTRVLDMA